MEETSGSRGRREKDLWAGMLSRKPLWILWPVTWEGTRGSLVLLAPSTHLLTQGHLLWGGLRGQVGHLLWRRDCVHRKDRERRCGDHYALPQAPSYCLWAPSWWGSWEPWAIGS